MFHERSRHPRRSWRRPKLAAIALGASLLAVLAACAPTSPSSGEDGGTLTIGMPGNTSETLDPHITNAASADLLRSAQLFDGLTEVDFDGSTRMGLAESFEPNATADVWTVHLRPDVAMHDGSTLTADDVVASVQRILDPANAARGANLLKFLTPEGVEKIDDLTVQFTLTQPYGPFPDVWASNYLRIAKADFDPSHPVGSGPFKFVSFTPGESSVFERFDDYWGGAPKVAELDVIGFADSDATINALRGGQIDIAYSVPLAQAESLEATNGINLLSSQSGLYLPIVFRTDLAPFNDPRVVEAMKLIVDRQEMIDSVLAGHGRVANDYISGYDACGDPGLEQREQDIARAKELLAEAGQSDLSFELTTTPGTAGMVETAVVFAEQAKEAGVTVTVNQLDEASFLAKYLEWPAAIDFYSSPYLQLIPLTLQPGGGGNASHFDDPEFNSVAAELFTSPDADRRCELVNQLKAIEYERGPNIVWSFVDVLSAYRDNVGGLQSAVDGQALFRLNDVTVD